MYQGQGQSHDFFLFSSCPRDFEKSIHENEINVHYLRQEGDVQDSRLLFTFTCLLICQQDCTVCYRRVRLEFLRNVRLGPTYGVRLDFGY